MTGQRTAGYDGADSAPRIMISGMLAGWRGHFNSELPPSPRPLRRRHHPFDRRPAKIDPPLPSSVPMIYTAMARIRSMLALCDISH
ncbi:hypothetical protein [Micromonospora sediminicola]|uniref:hypothetical protein n=1 Tax=Micromonospora sediminicola TaxID=946078 RepID=UPI0037932EC7